MRLRLGELKSLSNTWPFFFSHAIHHILQLPLQVKSQTNIRYLFVCLPSDAAAPTLCQNISAPEQQEARGMIFPEEMLLSGK